MLRRHMGQFEIGFNWPGDIPTVSRSRADPAANFSSPLLMNGMTACNFPNIRLNFSHGYRSEMPKDTPSANWLASFHACHAQETYRAMWAGQGGRIETC